MDAKVWIGEYARRLELEPPSDDEFDAILELAAEAAHASERVAAPVACWLSAKAGLGLPESIDAARAVSGGGDGPD